MTGEHLLAIDAGTQSVRALVFDLAGNLLHRARVPLPAPCSPQPGWAETDPAIFWKAVGQACRGLWAAGASRDGLAGVALTTQRGTVLAVDERGAPLRPAILWLDKRRAVGVPRIGGLLGLALRAAGVARVIATFQDEAEVNWIARHEPEVHARTHKFLLLSGYLTHRLTGRFVDSVGCQVAYLPLDYRRQRWASPSDWKWRALAVTRERLPELVPVTEMLGGITKEAAEATGIPQGLPVVAAGADKACEVLGAGGFDPHVGCLSFGTTATFNTTHRKYVEPDTHLPPYPAAIPGAYSVEVQIYRGFWMVTWFKEQFAAHEERRAKAMGVEPEALFDELVEKVPPGAMGLTLQPYWSPGVRRPGPEAKGSIIGFGDVHTRAHVYRAILEGLAYALREGKERTERRSGIPVTELRVAGGGAQSDAAMRITADVFGLPAARPHVTEASGLGAAMDAAVGLKLHASIEEASRAMTRTGRVFEPDARTSATYDALYRRVYRRMYRRLKPLYEEIRAITGYPA